MYRLFWSWFDVYRPTFDEDMREKRSFTFSLPVTLTLTFRPQICSPSFFALVQRYVSTKLEVSTAFLFLRKSEAQYRRTDGHWTDRQAPSYLRSARRHYVAVPRHSLSSHGRRAFCCCQPDWLELTE